MVGGGGWTRYIFVSNPTFVELWLSWSFDNSVSEKGSRGTLFRGIFLFDSALLLRPSQFLRLSVKFRLSSFIESSSF